MSVLGSQQSNGPLARVLLLALIAASLAFIDSRSFATFTSPTGFQPSLIRVALLLGAMLCLAALYAEGAIPAGPAGRTWWRDRFLTVALCVAALGVCRALLHLLDPFLPATTPPLVVDPVFYALLGIKVDATAATIALVLVLYALAVVFLAVLLPACMLRFGSRGPTGRSWLAFRKHWLAIGARALVMVPIAFITVPALSYWRVDAWQQSADATPAQTDAFLFATLMCQAIGPAGIAYSAFGGTLLFGLFLWWIGHATGVRLDRRD